MNIIAATEKELLGEDEAKLMNTWLTIRGELLGSSRKTNTYLVNCMKYLETQKYAYDPLYFCKMLTCICREMQQYNAEGDDDESRLGEIQKRMEQFLKELIKEERRMRNAGSVVVRPSSLEDDCFSGLRNKIVKEDKADYLLSICLSVYIIKTLRPLLKGRKGKGTIIFQQNDLLYCVCSLIRFIFSLTNNQLVLIWRNA
jgi:hypothetical protein